MAKKSYLKAYLAELTERGNGAMAESIKKTATEFSCLNLDTFSFAEHEVGLLFGNYVTHFVWFRLVNSWKDI